MTPARKPTLLGISPSLPGDPETRSRIALLFAFDELNALKMKWVRRADARDRRRMEVER